MDASDRDRKKAWKLQQRKLAQDAFPISDALLESLFQAVNAKDRELGLRPHIAIHSGMDSKKQATGGGNTYVVTRTRWVLRL